MAICVVCRCLYSCVSPDAVHSLLSCAAARLYRRIVRADGGLHRVFSTAVAQMLTSSSKFARWLAPNRSQRAYTDVFQKLKQWRNTKIHRMFVEVQVGGGVGALFVLCLSVVTVPPFLPPLLSPPEVSRARSGHDPCSPVGGNRQQGTVGNHSRR